MRKDWVIFHAVERSLCARYALWYMYTCKYFELQWTIASLWNQSSDTEIFSHVSCVSFRHSQMLSRSWESLWKIVDWYCIFLCSCKTVEFIHNQELCAFCWPPLIWKCCCYLYTRHVLLCALQVCVLLCALK